MQGYVDTTDWLNEDQRGEYRSIFLSGNRFTPQRNDLATDNDGEDIAIVNDDGDLEPPIEDDGTPTPAADVTQFTTQKISGYEVVTSPVTIYYQTSSSTYDPETDTITPTQLEFEIITGTDDSIAPGSLMFELGSHTYIDRDGIIYKDHDTETGAALAVGQINYGDRTVTLDSWEGGASPGVTILAAATLNGQVATPIYTFRTPGAPIRPESMQVTVTQLNGDVITGQADVDGIISNGNLTGVVDVENGVVSIHVTSDPTDSSGASDIPVFVDNARYNAVLFSFLPLDAGLIGLDPVRLPKDGRVPVYRQGDVIVISHTATTDIGTPAAGAVETLARDHQASIEIVDSADLKLDPVQYTANKVAGTVTFADPLTLETADQTPVALTPPLTIRDRIEHMSVVNDVQITGELTFIAPTAHTFPADETVVSSAKVWGDVNARAFNFFTQRTWNSGSPNWTDTRIGDDTTANFNIVDQPLEYANNGAITEKWALVFTSSTGFNIVGQTLGVIGTGNTSVDVAPQNPNTGNPYFVMRAAGFGSGWSAGNAIRFDTEGALAPMWVARTTLSGGATEDDDRVVLQVRGDAD